jgi:UrcA family protein
MLRILTAAAILALSANAALADSQASVDVPFGDLNLSRSHDAKILAERLETAASAVCLKVNRDMPGAIPAYAMQDCIDTAVNIAVSRIQSSLENKLRATLVNARHLQAAP